MEKKNTFWLVQNVAAISNEIPKKSRNSVIISYSVNYHLQVRVKMFYLRTTLYMYCLYTVNRAKVFDTVKPQINLHFSRL
jgi:hypothetical protein